MLARSTGLGWQIPLMQVRELTQNLPVSVYCGPDPTKARPNQESLYTKVFDTRGSINPHQHRKIRQRHVLYQLNMALHWKDIKLEIVGNFTGRPTHFLIMIKVQV